MAMTRSVPNGAVCLDGERIEIHKRPFESGRDTPDVALLKRQRREYFDPGPGMMSGRVAA